MHFIKKKLWFKNLWIFFEDGLYVKSLSEGKFAQITAISYNRHDAPTHRGIVRIREKTTACIDLTASVEEILKRMNDTTRNEIRRSLKNPDISCKQIGGFDAVIYSLYSLFEKAQGRKPMKKSEFGLYRYFICSYKDEPFSVVSVIEAAPYLRVRSIFSKRLEVGSRGSGIGQSGLDDHETGKIISQASRRTFYEICSWGHENSFVSLDMASVNFNNPATANITKFKMSFGGVVRNEYTHIYYGSWFAKLYVRWQTLRKIF